jgi:hypothetical protein
MSASEGNHVGHGPPPPPEPKTPMWLPAVGAALFLTVGLVWGLSGPSKDATEGGGAAPTASAAPAAAPDAGAAAAPRH